MPHQRGRRETVPRRVDAHICTASRHHAGPAPTASTAPTIASHRDRTSCWSTLRQGVRRRLRRKSCSLRPGRPEPTQHRQPRPHHDLRGHQPLLRLGHRPPAEAPLRGDGHLRGPRQGHDHDAPGRAGVPARHLRRSGAPGDHQLPQGPRRHRHRADAGPPVPAGRPPARPGHAQLLGLQHLRLPRAAPGLRGVDQARRRGVRVQGRAFTTPTSRSSSTWSTTTAESNHMGPTICFGIDNAAYYRLVEGDKRTTWTTRARHSLNVATRTAAADHGLSATGSEMHVAASA